MTREWIEAIFDRTYGSVTSVQQNPDQENPKGCWNAIDLNRIEKNTAYCAEWMLEQKIVRTPPGITVKENDYWQSNIIPTKAEIDRIINNVKLLITLSSSNPAIADQLPTIYAATQINYVLANQIEFALALMHNQPKLPLEYKKVTLNYGLITTIKRDDGYTETINATEALVAEDEVVTIMGTEYGEYAQYQTFTYWSGSEDDIKLLANYKNKQTTFKMPYGRDIELTANFETHIPRTLTLNNGYISLKNDPKAETGPSVGTYLAGEQIMIIANRAALGKAFYEWTGTQEGLDNIVGVTDTEDPSTAILTMPDCDVKLTPRYINAGKHLVKVIDGTGEGQYNYKDLVSISANVPPHYGFDNWSGDTRYLTDITQSYQSFEMGDENLTFRANYSYRYSYNGVQVIDGYIKINDQNLTEANNLMQTTSYTLVPSPPDDTQGLYKWNVEGEGSIGTDILGNHTNTFTVGDGNAIITGIYKPKHKLTIVNMNNSGSNNEYSLVEGRKQRFNTTRVVGSYRFNGWYENGKKLSSSYYDFDITMGEEDRTIEARYDYYETYTITLVNRNNSGQTATYSVLKGDYWEISTEEEVGDYLLDYWKKGILHVSTSTKYGFYPSEDTTLEIVYRPKETYHLTVENGTGSGDYKERQSVTITADSSLGDFSDWSYSNIYKITDAYSSSTTVKLGRSNGTVTANFNIRKITVVTNTKTTVYAIRQGNYSFIDAGTAPDGYEFNHWETTSGDATFANAYNSGTRVYAKTSDSTVTAIYTPIPKFTVTMIDGYITDYTGTQVTSATLLRDATNEIQMKPAATNYKFLQWEVYVNGSLITDANDVYEPFAETTHLRGLSRDITIKATYYQPGSVDKYTLTITRDDGTIEQNQYKVGQDVDIRASVPKEGMRFLKWTGDTAYIAGGIYNSTSYVRMPAQNIAIQETFISKDVVPTYHLVMKNIYGECCYETSYTNPDTGEVTVTKNWVSDYKYEEGSKVEIRTKDIPPENYFIGWDAVDTDTNADAKPILDSLTDSPTFLIMPGYNVTVEPKIGIKETYHLLVNDGGTSGWYQENKRADIYFGKVDTDDIHYEFIRWTGIYVTKLELFDGGMFNVRIAGTEAEPQFIKMPAIKEVELTPTYKTKYRLTVNNGVIDKESTNQGYYEAGTKLTITANAPAEGMKFQYWTGDTSELSSIYDPTPTITTVTGTTTITPVYSLNSDENSIGYSLNSLKNTTVVSNNDITVVSGQIEVGFILTDSLGHIYVITNVNNTNNTSTIYRMTKTNQGGNVYG